MAAEEVAAEQELAGERFGAGEVAVGLDPHAADWLPAAFGDARLDRLEQLRVVLAHIVIELGLALGEVVVGELLHEAHDGVEGAAGLAPRLAQSPQPGGVDVGVAAGDDADVHRLAGLGDALAQSSQCAGDTGVEGVAERLAQVHQFEGIV